jgi:hypothetical protein
MKAINISAVSPVVPWGGLRGIVCPFTPRVCSTTRKAGVAPTTVRRRPTRAIPAHREPRTPIHCRRLE